MPGPQAPVNPMPGAQQPRGQQPLRLIKATAALQNPAQMPQHMAAQQQGASEAPMGAGSASLPPWLTATPPAQQRPTGAQGAQYPRGAEPWYEDLSEGAVAGMMSLGSIPFDIAGHRSEKYDALQKDWQDDSEQSLWGVAGQYGIPGLGAARGAFALKKAIGAMGGKSAKKLVKYLKDEIDGAGMGTAAQSKKGRRS